MHRISILLAASVLLLGASPPETPPDLDSCPSLKRCCAEGEEDCTHPGAARGLLFVTTGGAAALGTVGFLTVGDSLNAGDPFSQMIGVGGVGLLGSGLGAIFGLLAPNGETSVDDHPGRPTFRLALSPGGSSILDESSPYGLGLSIDPRIDLGPMVDLQPHLALSIGLGTSSDVDPRPQHDDVIDGQDTTFPVALETWRMKLSAGAELSVRLPYPLAVRRPAFTGRLELRYRPQWELRRRVLHPGDDDRSQVVEHNALYPATFGLRWHVSPRQRFTVYVGPRIDWIAFSDPGTGELRRGGANLGTLLAEAWWQLDVPFTPHGHRATSVTGRLNLGYVHSNLDGVGFDLGAIVGYFGPVELSFDLRLRKRGSPIAVQLTAGVLVGAGGGPFLEVGFVAPNLGSTGGGS